MIIASPAKKELAIQLQVLQTTTTSSPSSVTSTTSRTTTTSASSTSATTRTLNNNNTQETVCFPHEYCSNSNDQDVVTVSKRELGKEKRKR